MLRSTLWALLLAGAHGLRFPVTPIGQLRSQTAGGSSAFTKRDVDPSTLYPEYNLSVPIDHFHNQSCYEPHSDGHFNLRYWFDDTYYKPGGPVIILEGGETDASSRLPYLQKGIVYELSKAVGGLGVIIEHRYYGTSFPTPDLSTENLRFLTTDQALADTAYFAQHVVFKGHEHRDLTPRTTPWIAYGGSYAGAFAAFLRTQYPGVFFGAISSSGVTEAIYDYWQYYEPIAQYGPKKCIRNAKDLTHVVDQILLECKDSPYVAQLKSLFGLSELTYDNDFANAISGGPSNWQVRNWDPEVNSPAFDEWCGNITSDTNLYPATDAQVPTIRRILKAAGYSSKLTVPMQNYIGWVNTSVVQPAEGEITQSYDNHNATFFAQDDLSQTWRSWPGKYSSARQIANVTMHPLTTSCEQWGYLQTGSGVPKDQLPLISRTVDLPYSELICNLAFNITAPPDVAAINSRGGYNIRYPRLAIIDGEVDPWRYATPHSNNALPWTHRNSLEEPFYLIPNSVHHWDENGLFANETTKAQPPAYIKDVHAYEVQFVKKWMAEAKAMGYGARKGSGGGRGGSGRYGAAL